jgi:hypothetical protein
MDPISPAGAQRKQLRPSRLSAASGVVGGKASYDQMLTSLLSLPPDEFAYAVQAGARANGRSTFARTAPAGLVAASCLPDLPPSAPASLVINSGSSSASFSMGMPYVHTILPVLATVASGSLSTMPDAAYGRFDKHAATHIIRALTRDNEGTRGGYEPSSRRPESSALALPMLAPGLRLAEVFGTYPLATMERVHTATMERLQRVRRRRRRRRRGGGGGWSRENTPLAPPLIFIIFPGKKCCREKAKSR